MNIDDRDILIRMSQRLLKVAESLLMVVGSTPAYVIVSHEAKELEKFVQADAARDFK